MFQSRAIALVLVATSLVGGAVGIACSSSSSSNTPAPVNQAVTDVVTIGAVLSLSGSLNYLGGPEEQGMRVAVSQVNALGGVLGKNLAVKLVDDATDPTQSAAAYTGLLPQNPIAFLGPTGSPAAVADGPVSFTAQVFTISPSASTPVMTDAQPARDRYFFRTAASHALQAKALATWMLRGPAGGTGCRKPAVIFQNDAFGAPIASGFAASVAAAQLGDGGTASVAVSVSVPATPKGSYTDEVNQVLASGADCQMLALFQPLAKQYVVDWLKATVGNAAYGADKFLTLGCNALKVDTFISSTRQNPADPASKTGIEGMYVLNFDTNPITPEFGVFKNLFTSQFPLAQGAADISPYTANTYDAVILIALAIEQAGTTDISAVADKVKLRDSLIAVSKGGASYGPSQVGDALAAIRAGKDVDYKGASGDVDFDDYGDVQQDFAVFLVKNGAFQVIERIKASTL